MPLVCGGYADADSSAEECYKYSPQSDSWQIYGTLPYAKTFSAHAYAENFGLVMAGSEYDVASSVTVTRDGQNFQELASLPNGGDYGGCLAVVDENTLVYTGGHDDYYGAYSYDIPSDTWTT